MAVNGSMSISLDEKDYAKIQAALSQMSQLEKNATVKRGLEEGLTLIKTEGKKNLSIRNKKKTGNLSRSFKLMIKPKAAKGHAGFKRSSRKSPGGGNHAHLVDRGTKERWTRKGQYRGSVSKGMPNHGSMFWTDAFYAKKKAAMEELIESVSASLQKIINHNR